MEKPTTERLWTSFTPQQLQEKGQELANACIELGDVAYAKKKSSDEFKLEMDGIEGKIGRLSDDIRAKGEETDIACIVRFHLPRTAFKQTVRLDTGELVREEQMSPTECQEHLFEGKEIDELLTQPQCKIGIERTLASEQFIDTSLVRAEHNGENPLVPAARIK